MNGLSYREFLELKLKINLPKYTLAEILNNCINNAVINQTIDVDLVNLGLVKSSFTNKLKKLLLIISQSNPFELNITKVSANIEVSRNTLYAYLDHLDKGGLINLIGSTKKGLSKLSKPEKLYLNNTNIFYTFVSESKIDTIRETFFVSQLKHLHNIEISNKGDFFIDNKYTFEVGGESKIFNQIKDINNSYLVIDTDSTENEKKFLFGCLDSCIKKVINKPKQFYLSPKRYLEFSLISSQASFA